MRTRNLVESEICDFLVGSERVAQASRLVPGANLKMKPQMIMKCKDSYG
jgi:hypothetical protein